MRATFTPEEALQAIVARLKGEWDSPALTKFGPLLTRTDQDVYDIAACAKRPNHAQLVMDEALQTGIAHLGGEMSIPIADGIAAAYKYAVNVAEQCGYLVSYTYGKSAIKVTGGDLAGYWVLDWYESDRPKLGKIEHWSAEWAHAPL
jgi:hypothetical protein